MFIKETIKYQRLYFNGNFLIHITYENISFADLEFVENEGWNWMKGCECIRTQFSTTLIEFVMRAYGCAERIFCPLLGFGWKQSRHKEEMLTP